MGLQGQAAHPCGPNYTPTSLVDHPCRMNSSRHACVRMHSLCSHLTNTDPFSNPTPLALSLHIMIPGPLVPTVAT